MVLPAVYWESAQQDDPLIMMLPAHVSRICLHCTNITVVRTNMTNSVGSGNPFPLVGPSGLSGASSTFVHDISELH